jgi:DNA-binding MarR family transcriptional regulator
MRASEDDSESDCHLDSDVVGRFSLSITRLARILRQQDSSQLTPALASALATIVRQGPISLRDLAAAEGVSPSTITKLVARLESEELIERVLDSRDRRVHWVMLSAGGRRRIERYRVSRNAWLAEQLSRLAEPERQHLGSVLAVLERLAAVAGPDPVGRPLPSDHPLRGMSLGED